MLPSAQGLRSRLDRATGQRDGLRSRAAAARTQIKQLEEEEALLVLVTTFLQQLIDQEVTLGVQAVERLQAALLGVTDQGWLIHAPMIHHPARLSL